MKKAVASVIEVFEEIWDWLIYSGVGTFIVLFAVFFTLGNLIVFAIWG